jgi:enamine deaminase RidA (YjgF/YER057c/UK114 family)
MLWRYARPVRHKSLTCKRTELHVTIQRIAPNGRRLSGAVVHNGVVYVAGQTAVDRTKDVSGQTAEVLAKIDDLLTKAGSDRSRILYTQIWLKNVGKDFAAMNAVWESWIPADALPARATVEAKLAAEDLVVEIAVQAAVK